MIYSIKIFKHIMNASLVITKNKNLTNLPEIPDYISGLVCSDNNLISLPKLPNRLLVLECCNNNLISLPKLPDGLRVLKAETNKLTYLPELPDGLITLSISCNFIKSYYTSWEGKKYVNVCTIIRKKIKNKRNILQLIEQF